MAVPAPFMTFSHRSCPVDRDFPLLPQLGGEAARRVSETLPRIIPHICS